jgi:hypothetical protein
MAVKRAPKSPSRKPVEEDEESRLETPSAVSQELEGEEDDDIIFPDLTNPNTIVRLTRLDDVTRKKSPHGTLALSEARYSKVAELFGGGSYKAQAFVPDPTGSLKICGTRTWIIPGAYRPPMTLPGNYADPSKQEPASMGPTFSPGQVPAGGISMNEGLNMVLVSQILETVQKSRQAMAPPENSLLTAVLPKVVEVLGEIMTNKRDSGSDTLKEILLQQQNDIKELRASLAAKPDTPTKSLKETIEDVMSIRQLIEGGGGEKMDSESMMWAAGLKALEAMTGAKAAPPTPTAVNPQQAMIADPNTPIWKKVLQGQKSKLLMAAGFGLDPYFAADTAIKTMPPQIHGALVEFLQKPDHVSLAMQEVPELRNFETWTAEFFQAASDIMLGEPEGGDDEAPAATSE